MKTPFLLRIGLCLSMLLSQFLYSQSFEDVTDATGINHRFDVGDLLFGGGAAVFDFNNDGWEDLYLTGGVEADALYQNNGDGTFTNVRILAGIVETDLYLTTGVVTGDIDNDGFRDVFISTRCQSGDLNEYAPNLLYLNNGDGTFSNISAAAGIAADTSFSTSATFGDINNDGYLDLYVGNFFLEPYYEFATLPGDWFDMLSPPYSGGPNLLYLNNGDLTFTESALSYGVADTGYAWQVTFSDFDNDRDMDLIIANDFGWHKVPNRLYRNDYPASTFTDVSDLWGLNHGINGMGIAVGDYNEDGWFDYYVTNSGTNLSYSYNGIGYLALDTIAGIENTYLEAIRHQQCMEYTPDTGFVGLDSLILNYCDSTGLFCDTVTVYFHLDTGALSLDSMATGEVHIWGHADTELTSCPVFYDINGDTAFFDTLTGPVFGEAVLKEIDTAQVLSIGWGANFMDYDQDSYLDLYVSNGALAPSPFGFYRENSNTMYRNNGDGTYSETTKDLGLGNEYMGRGSVVFDYDKDGDLDLFAVNQRYPLFLDTVYQPHSILLENTAAVGNWLQVKCVGNTHNKDGIGARVKAVIGTRSHTKEIDGGSSHLSHNSIIAHFGLGAAPKVDTLVVYWHNGCKNVLVNVAANQLIEIEQGNQRANLPDTVGVCAGDSVELNAGLGDEYSYSWTTGGTSEIETIAPTTSQMVYISLDGVIGCLNKDSVYVAVHANPNPEIIGLAPAYCQSESPDTLSFVPSLGTASSFLVGGNTLDPSVLSAGMHLVTYATADTAFCPYTVSQSVFIYAQPPASILGLDTSYFLSDDPVLADLFPSGGTFAGAGVTGMTFDPGSAGPGTHLLTYLYTNPISGCSAIDSVEVFVDFTTTLEAYTEEISIQVFPNPFAESFKMKMETMHSDPIQVRFMDLRGKLIWEEEKLPELGQNL